MSWIRMKWEDFKAWRRGEHRIKPGRGRVYAKKDGARDEQASPQPRKTKATITAKVTRADGAVELYEADNVRISPVTCPACGGETEPAWFDEESVRCVGCKRPVEYCNCGGQ